MATTSENTVTLSGTQSGGAATQFVIGVLALDPAPLTTSETYYDLGDVLHHRTRGRWKYLLETDALKTVDAAPQTSNDLVGLYEWLMTRDDGSLQIVSCDFPRWSDPAKFALLSALLPATVVVTSISTSLNKSSAYNVMTIEFTEVENRYGN